MNNRRKLLLALGAGALAVPLGSYAQQRGKVWRIGFLWERVHADPFYVPAFKAFKSGMRELGYTEGKHYVIEQRYAQNEYARLPALAAELLALKVDIIVSSGTPSAMAARSATREIPILITTAADPVGSGLVASLRRPGGNVTGLTQGVGQDVNSKRLDLLRQIVPGMRRVGILYNPDSALSSPLLKQFESDCGKLQFSCLRAPLRKREEIAAVFNILKRDQAQGLIVSGDSTNTAWQDSIVEYAAKHRLPLVSAGANFVKAGVLFAYGTNPIDLYRRAATYADKIFKGAKPGDLPIEQPTKFEMVLNLKTAKALGIKIPEKVLLRADTVIE